MVALHVLKKKKWSYQHLLIAAAFMNDLIAFYLFLLATPTPIY